jgi:hypothetical protein
MKFTSDPAYKTSTGPDPVAEAEAEADAGALLPEELAGADAAGELELDELLDELHPATATATATPAITSAFRKIITGRPYQGTSHISTTRH